MRRTLVLAGLLLAGVLPAIPASAGIATCLGQIVTVPGTDGPDVLIGTAGTDVFDGGAGDDLIRGKGGDDIICAGDGDDEVYGGSGADIIRGGGDDDTLYGQSGEDDIRGGGGSDTIDGGQDRDRLRGGRGGDEILGSGAKDVIHGNRGNDVARGGGGRDKCFTSEELHSCLLGLELVEVAQLPGGHRAGVAVSPPNDPRLFLVDQSGPIWEVGSGGIEPTPLIDLTGRLSTNYEQGVLGLAFHPDYESNGRFFVYSSQPDWDIVIEEFVDDGDWPIDPADGSTVIEIDHGGSYYHYGGMLAFGPDSYLYASVGDGGTGGGEGQDITSLLGTIIRLDVDSASPYANPPDNPFVGKPGKNQIWAYGLRNPWRFSFDDGHIYIADVGQSLREEVDVADAAEDGINYGWDVLEGTLCHNPSSGCSSAGTMIPILEEKHSDGSTCSIIGGYVYRGSRLPELDGHYLYGDYCGGYLKTFRYANGSAKDKTTWIGDTGHSLSSFGMDSEGDLYVATTGGTLYRIDPVR